MSNGGSGLVADRLLDVLDRISVDLDGLRGTVDGDAVTADSVTELQDGLTALVYGALHSGLRPVEDEESRSTRDRGAEARLRAATPHASTRCSGVPVLTRDEPDGSVVVWLDGVRVRIPAQNVRTVSRAHGAPRAQLSIPAVRPALSPGFFLADSSGERLATPHGAFRVYVHVTSIDAGVVAWERVLAVLEAGNFPYRAKVVSAPAGYPRRDALVVYLDPAQQHTACQIRETVSGLDGIGEQTSVFARQIGPGVAIADDPADTRERMRGLSFGQHRSAALVDGIFDFRTVPSGRSLEACVAGSLTRAAIDPRAPERNR